QIGFELKYEHKLVNGYVPHRSLINLKTSIANLTSLHILLHYLPRLQHLDVSVTNKIAMTDLTEHLPARLNHPKELRTLKLRGILPKNAESNVQLSHYSLLHLEAPINGNTVYDFQSLVGWVRLLPNIKCLTCNLTELRYWFSNDLHNQYLDSFLQRLDRLYVNCSCIITREMNEELLTPLL
ncbi:unnamed protein product, partial [Rotaria magnacalcarata]